MNSLIGNKLPDITMIQMSAENGPTPTSIANICENKKVIIFGVPGAFLPVCSKDHLPGYIDNYETIKAKNIDEIICFATNDIFTINAWEEMTGGSNKILFLSDGKADFAKAIGTDYPDTFGTSIKTQRCSMIVDQGIITHFFLEEDASQAHISGAENIIKVLDS